MTSPAKVETTGFAFPSPERSTSSTDVMTSLNDTFVIRKRPADALIVLPALKRFWDKMPGASQQLANDNMGKIRQHWEKFFEFIQYHREYKYPFVPDMDPDAALYQDGFFCAQEKKQSDKFHKFINTLKSGNLKADLQRLEILNKIKSPRIKNLASRILARNFEDKTGQIKETEYHFYLNRLSSSLEKDQIIGYKNDIKFNCAQGLQELKEIEHSLLNPNQDQIKMLNWLNHYIESL